MLSSLLRQHRRATGYTATRHDSIGHYASVQIDALLAEFHTALLFSSVCSNIVDALLRGDHVRLPGAMAPYFPPNSAIYAHATTSADIDPSTQKIALLLQEFYMRAGFSQRVSSSTLSDSNRTPTLRELEVMANSWHRVVAAGTIASHRIREVEGLSTETLDKLDTTLRQCRAISSDEPKCVLSDGTVIVPFWAECRVDVRIQAAIPVNLIISNKRHQVVLRDVSYGGAGLQNVPESPVGTSVMIELPDRSSLGGHVVWNRSGRMGIEFDEPLPDGHWLMLEVDAVSR